MRQFIFAVAAILMLSGCATVTSVPVPPERNVASNDEYLDLAFNRYFANQNLYTRLVRLEMLVQQLQGVMPEKGNAKKSLVKQFETDLHKAVVLFASDETAVASSFKSWLPSSQENGFNEKVRTLGKVLQSSKVMDRLGIYLTASGVFDEDSFGQAFYFDLIGRALAEIDSELRNLVLVYPPEQKDADESQAKLTYAKGLAVNIRANLRRVMPAVNSANYKKVDALLKRFSSVTELTPMQARNFVNSADFKFAKNILSQVQPTTSGDILGFEDQVDATVATKFSFEMINQLISTVR